MEEISVTWKRAARIWWSWFWRAMLWTMPTAMGIGFIVGMAFGISGTPIEPFEAYLQLMGALVGLFFGIFAMKTILTKRFNGYRLMLVKTEDETQTPDGFNA